MVKFNPFGKDPGTQGRHPVAALLPRWSDFMTYQAVLFDMDGVVVDTNQSVTRFWLELADQHQIQLSQTDFEENIYGCTASHTLGVLFPQLTAGQRQAVFDWLAVYEDNLAYQPIPGAIGLLRVLRKHEIATALVTSGDRAKVRAVSQQLGLAGLFTKQITVEDVEQGKPHPECYQRAAAALRVSPERCVVFEDAVSGVQAAVAAGALCVGVQQGRLADLLRRAGARTTVPDLRPVRVKHTSAGLQLVVGPETGLPLAAR
jgi:HAD superfamily hydrolase (TIGR01509 family)